mmetsp:Transcript_29958/g.26521  ORF Transcript_29958/g.26521 Transcript_29958/m.26521 type:complete len:165 (+) Transcript_29958:1098-1592(+)
MIQQNKTNSYGKSFMLINNGSKSKSSSKSKGGLPLNNKRQVAVSTYSNIMQKKYMKVEQRRAQHSTNFSNNNSTSVGTYQIMMNNSASPKFNSNRSKVGKKKASPKESSKSPYNKRMMLHRGMRNKSKNNINKVTSLTINNYHCKGVKIGVPNTNISGQKKPYL